MRVAVDTRFLQEDKFPALQTFTQEVLDRMVKQHAEHQFIFFVDDASNGFPPFPANVSVVTITPRPKNILSYKWWYDVKLPLVLKKFKADIFVGLNGLCSLQTSVPQVLVIHNLSFLQKKRFCSANALIYYKQNTARFIKKAAAIATLSDYVKQEISENYKMEKEAIQTLGSGVNELFKPVEWDDRDEIKEKFAEGCEYFVFPGRCLPHLTLINALKAFSIFKKWQKTNMKLVITADFAPDNTTIRDKLNSYKYRNEVYLKECISTIESKIIAGSYAVIFPSFYEGFGTPVLQTMQCEVPVITSANSSMSEIAGDAALYADPANPEDIAEQMKRIFKDEQLRKQLIEKGKQRVKLFSWDNTSELLWQLTEQTILG